MTATIPTPLGPMLAVATDAGVALCDFADRPGLTAAADRMASAGGGDHLGRLRDEIAAYFDGRTAAFTVPLDASAGTAFQRAAWAFLWTIPFGQTRTYGQQAAALGSPAAARAVGRANGANPLCVVVPCHRVIGSTGRLVGFGGGVDRKRWLLDHERACSGPLSRFTGRGSL